MKRFNRVNLAETAITIITWEEQMRGRLNVIRRASSSTQRISAYTRLEETIEFLRIFNLINFDQAAETYYTELLRQRIRMGTQDLRIAAIALSRNAIVVTRNQRDFAKVPGLILEDWTVA